MFHRPKTQEEQTSQLEKAEVVAEEQMAPAAPASEESASHLNIPAFVQKAPVAAPAAPAPAEPEPETTNETTTTETEEDNQPEEANEERVMSQDQSYQAQTTTSYTAPSANDGQGYDGTGYGNAYSQTPSSGMSSQSDDRKLVIGQGITMSGEIEACDNLIVEGTVEAALKGAEILEITETGVFYGAVEIEEATIAGRFEGDITVNGKLTVLSSGAITGSIVYRELAVEAGAVIDGKISPMGSESAKKSSKPAEKKSKAATSKSSAPANELPFAGNAAAVAAE